jgi:hypothetical protein
MILDEIAHVLGEAAFNILKMGAPVLMAYLENQPVPALVLHILVGIFDHHDKDISTLGEVIENDLRALCKINAFDLSFCKTMRKSLDASNKEKTVHKVDAS